MVPVFKNVGESTAAKNYHSVSLLCLVSKVFEKLVNTVNSVEDDQSWDHSKVVILDRWSSYKTPS